MHARLWNKHPIFDNPRCTVLDGWDKQRRRINECAILLVFPATHPHGMREVLLGMVDVACRDAQEVTKKLQFVLLNWIADCHWWAKKVVTFEVDGASNLVMRVPLHAKLLMSPPLKTMCLPSLGHGWS